MILIKAKAVRATPITDPMALNVILEVGTFFIPAGAKKASFYC
jgi:hypothetical protein